ncbi:hypothetical protein PoB_000152700 [Plakobranchus ocellatus]|uniref:Uncharacterized protein n=1 Tax=Plakobranchus ocellatus TaxID=259542 RepID=A0AAV3XYV0_9GAST|nr:hypothetical protein PoB_000152700 [Plakobranchus ocellatus]
MGFAINVVLVVQTVVVAVTCQSNSVYSGARDNYFDGNTKYAAGGINNGALTGNLDNNAFSNGKNRLYSDGFSRNAQGSGSNYFGNRDVKNTGFTGGGNDGKYFSSSTSNNKNNRGAFSSSDNNNAYTTSTRSNNAGDGTVSKSFSNNIDDIQKALGGDGGSYYQEGQEGIQAAVNTFGSGSLDGILGPQPTDYGRQARPNVDSYFPVDGRSLGNGPRVGYVNTYLNPQSPNAGSAFGKDSYNYFGGPSSYNQYDRGQVFRPVQVRESKVAGSKNANRQYAPIITRSYIPPTTYSGADDPKVDSFFEVTNPLSNKRAVISGYRPSNNFVNPSHFIIPKEDKYEMVDQLFGGGFGQPRDRGLSANPLRSLDRTPKYPSVEDGLKNLGSDYYPDKSARRNDFSLGFFNDDDNVYAPEKRYATPAISDKLPQTTTSLDASSQKKPPKATIQSFADKGGNQASFKSGQGFQNHVGYTDQGRKDIDNSYDIKSSTGDIGTVSRRQGQDTQYSEAFRPSQARTYFGDGKAGPRISSQKINPFTQGREPLGQQQNTLLNKQPSPNFFSSPKRSQFTSIPQSTIGDNPYQGSGVFNKQQNLTPLFNGFSNNERLTVNEFKNKNLLGDNNFGKTDYDRKRPTSTSILGSDLYRQANFGGQNSLRSVPEQQQQYSQAFQTNRLSNAPALTDSYNTFSSSGASPQQGPAFDKGGGGYNLFSGKTQTTGTSFDDGHSNSQGYTNSFDDSISKATGDQNKGGFSAYDEKKKFNSGSKLGVIKGPGSNAGILQGSFPPKPGTPVKFGGVQGKGITNPGQGLTNQYGANRLSQSAPGSVTEEGGFSKSYQSSDSYNDNDAYSSGDSYSNKDRYRDGNSVADQYRYVKNISVDIIIVIIFIIVIIMIIIIDIIIIILIIIIFIIIIIIINTISNP